MKDRRKYAHTHTPQTTTANNALWNAHTHTHTHTHKHTHTHSRGTIQHIDFPLIAFEAFSPLTSKEAASNEHKTIRCGSATRTYAAHFFATRSSKRAIETFRNKTKFCLHRKRRSQLSVADFSVLYGGSHFSRNTCLVVGKQRVLL